MAASYERMRVTGTFPSLMARFAALYFGRKTSRHTHPQR